ncbi:hypothetical protein ACFQL1_11640 [Halomicroarcula sp. GCM10025709]|uniref:hypothetical protein n=1 Tax=Haloarcula TaxID=2237 RepID=UPI0024C30BFE|nr:hypothetical protein [Halomicroarcula sp. YJ-61-S]
MNRRTLLRCLGTAGGALVSGCLAGGPADDTPTDAPTTDRPPVVDTVEFSLRGRTDGQQRDTASVSNDASTVTVTGTIWGRNGCRTAQLSSATYDQETGELTVAVETVDRTDETAVACTQAIVEIRYRVVVSMSRGLPETVVVTHDRGDGPQEVTRTSGM